MNNLENLDLYKCDFDINNEDLIWAKILELKFNDISVYDYIEILKEKANDYHWNKMRDFQDRYGEHELRRSEVLQNLIKQRQKNYESELKNIEILENKIRNLLYPKPIFNTTMKTLIDKKFNIEGS